MVAPKGITVKLELDSSEFERNMATLRAFLASADFEREVAWHSRRARWSRFWRGSESPWNCIEMIAGPGGWAVFYDEPLRLCPCGSLNTARIFIRSDEFAIEALVPS